MQTLLLIATALFAGLLMTRLFVKFHLPDVTAYLVAGVLIGPCVLGRLNIGFNTFGQVDSLSLISDVALGFIAFAIGHEFRLSALKQTPVKSLTSPDWCSRSQVMLRTWTSAR